MGRDRDGWGVSDYVCVFFLLSVSPRIPAVMPGCREWIKPGGGVRTKPALRRPGLQTARRAGVGTLSRQRLLERRSG